MGKEIHKRWQYANQYWGHATYCGKIAPTLRAGFSLSYHNRLSNALVFWLTLVTRIYGLLGSRSNKFLEFLNFFVQGLLIFYGKLVKMVKGLALD